MQTPTAGTGAWAGAGQAGAPATATRAPSSTRPWLPTLHPPPATTASSLRPWLIRTLAPAFRPRHSGRAIKISSFTTMTTRSPRSAIRTWHATSVEISEVSREPKISEISWIRTGITITSKSVRAVAWSFSVWSKSLLCCIPVQSFELFVYKLINRSVIKKKFLLNFIFLQSRADRPQVEGLCHTLFGPILRYWGKG